MFWLTLALVLSQPAAADILQLDLLFFEQPPWVVQRDGGRWGFEQRRLPPTADVETVMAQGGAALLGAEEAALSEAATRLRAEGYTLLHQLSVQFPQRRLAEALRWPIRSGEALLIEPPLAPDGRHLLGTTWYKDREPAQTEVHYAIEGWVRAWVDRYLFVEFDIAHTVGNSPRRDAIRRHEGGSAPLAATSSLLTPAYPMPLAEEPLFASETGELSTIDTWPAESVDLFRLNERKRVRLNEVHYFDHPRVGLLVKITEPMAPLIADTPP